MEIHPLVLTALYGLAAFGWWAACSENEGDGVAPFFYALFWPLVPDAKRLAMSVHLALCTLDQELALAPLSELASLARRAEAARSNPRALAKGGKRSNASWPLEEGHLPLWADMVSAVVISGKPNALKLRGLGQSSEAYWPGDREMAAATSMQQAAERALAEAGLSVSEIDLFELDGMTLYDEAIAFEAAGLVPRGGGMAALSDDPRCNPSGGSLAGYCPPAMGLTRVVEAIHQLRGTAGEIQQGKPRLAMASGASLMAAQTHTVVLLEAV